MSLRCRLFGHRHHWVKTEDAVVTLACHRCGVPSALAIPDRTPIATHAGLPHRHVAVRVGTENSLGRDQRPRLHVVASTTPQKARRSKRSTAARGGSIAARRKIA